MKRLPESIPDRFDILWILAKTGPLPYKELKLVSGYKTTVHGDTFQLNLKKLMRDSLVSVFKEDQSIGLTDYGKLVSKLVSVAK